MWLSCVLQMFTLVVNLVQTLHHIYSTFAGMIKCNINLMWYYYRALWYAFKESCDFVSIDVLNLFYKKKWQTVYKISQIKLKEKMSRFNLLKQFYSKPIQGREVGDSVGMGHHHSS